MADVPHNLQLIVNSAMQIEFSSVDNTVTASSYVKSAK